MPEADEGRIWRSARPRLSLLNGRHDWYRIENKADAEAADVFIYDEIGYFGTTASDFVRDLRTVTAGKINLHLNSPGGDVFDAIAIFNALKGHSASVDVFVDGLAASAASFIAQAGDRVVMMPHSRMMIHEAFGLVIGNADDMRKMADRLDASSDNIASIYAERAGEDTAFWRGKMRDETWYTDQEAVDAGLADEVGTAGTGDAQKQAARFNLAVFRHPPKDLVREAALLRDEEKNAGRTMSQANLDKLHDLMAGAGAIHSGTCDMGDSCPMYESDSNTETTAETNEAPDDALLPTPTPQELAKADLERRLALVKL